MMDPTEKIKIKILLLPHFEIGEIYDGFPGEAQLFYQHYCKGAREYRMAGGRTLYVNPENGVAIYITGPGKVNTAFGLAAILMDGRFDFSDAYLFTFGCAGAAFGHCIMGDVCLVTQIIDYDLGHGVDVREAEGGGVSDVWFPDEMFAEERTKQLNPKLVGELYGLVKNIPLDTTEATRVILKENYPGQAWAGREPKVLRGTSESGDNYWKGKYGHEKALYLAQLYGAPDPYAVSEMEDIAVANVADRFGMLDRLIAMHVCVNMDVFLAGDTPEKLWGSRANFTDGLDDGNSETLDIFETAMHNNFKVGRVIIDHLSSHTWKM